MALNSTQKQAVEYSAGPLLIVAGAGTGKTTVITEKIAYLIKEKLAEPEEILALTFTDKAAEEMRERVDKLINFGYAEMQISTFHSFAQRLLERYGLDIGLPVQFNLLTEIDSWLLIRKNLDKFNLDYYRPLGNPARHIHELLKHFSKCKDELITPAEYLKYAEEKKLDTDAKEIKNQKSRIKIKNKNGDEKETEVERLTEIASAYHTYNQLLLDNNCLDFGDLIFYTVQLLEKRPQILAALQKQFKYILVDEFQDVNWAQYYLVQQIANKRGQLTVVGDDDQSIYAFRGASVSNIMRFKDDFPQAKEVVLTENYRSDQKILDVAYEIIQNNNPDRLEVKLNINKKLIAKKIVSSKDNINYIHAFTLDEEVKAVIDEIEFLKNKDAEITWDDFAILVRANNHAEPFINALEKRDIPYEFLSAAGLYRQPVILDCLNFFKAITNYHESTAIFRLLNLAFLNLPDADLHKFTGFCKKKSLSYYEGLKRAGECWLSKEAMLVVEKILKIIQDGTQRSRFEKPTIVLYGFLEKSGYLQYFTQEEEQGNRNVIRQLRQLKQFFDQLAIFEQNTPDTRVRDFLEHYEFLSQAGDKGALSQPIEMSEAVNILTVHSAKGLEFKYVFIINLVEDRFPSRDRGEAIEIPLELIKEQLPEGDSHLEEERRLFYVAMTRAKERLYLTSATCYGGVRNKKISRFLDELGYVVSEKEDKKETVRLEIESKKNKETKGDFVFPFPNTFSFSQLKSYATCPYQYKLAHLLKVPFKGNAAFSFGQTMHSTLQEFYRRIQELNKVQQVSLFGPVLSTVTTNKTKAPQIEELFSIYDSTWIDDWYLSKNQREEYYIEGKKILKIFYESQKNNWSVPINLEGWFKIKIGDYLLNGRIDRIDQIADGRLEIIDYKTGKAKEKVTGDDKDQLLIYQIAVEQLPEYKQVGIPGKLTYYYLNENKQVSFFGTEEEKRELLNKLLLIIDRIHSGDFLPTPAQFICDHCDFKDICNYRN